jgi:hypothetical protein
MTVLGASVPVLYILGIGFGLLAILMPIALNDKKATGVTNLVTI